MNRKSLFYFVTVLAGIVFAQSTQAGDLRPGSGRAPASAREGQAETMLRNEKKSAPGFLDSSSRAPRSPVTITGVCRDSYGMIYGPSDPGFRTCVNSAPSSSSLRDYFGSAQRQAGVGVLLSD